MQSKVPGSAPGKACEERAGLLKVSEQALKEGGGAASTDDGRVRNLGRGDALCDIHHGECMVHSKNKQTESHVGEGGEQMCNIWTDRMHFYGIHHMREFTG